MIARIPIVLFRWLSLFTCLAVLAACSGKGALQSEAPAPGKPETFNATSTYQPVTPNEITPAPTIETITRTREIDGTLEILIPAGEFLMGADPADTLLYQDELPQHVVYLDAYWIDQHEVTNAQFALCVRAGACDEPYSFGSQLREHYYDDAQFSQHPVLYVDWYMARDYCAWAGGSLPSEAQWEKATRGTDGRIYPWGSQEPNANLLNYRHYVGDTAAVCSHPQGNSPYGLCDMAGNVWEWIGDWYDAGYYQSDPVSNPQGPASGSTKVLRGGSWFDGAGGVRASDRDWNYQDFAYYYAGFRCVRIP